MQDKVRHLILAEQANTIAYRRDFHQHPELGFEEFRTTDKVCQFLEDLGLSYKRMQPTGVMAELEGYAPGKTILLRADMDALPVDEEKKTLPYASLVPNCMHACGHDAHTAMLMSAVKVLNQLKDQFKGKVRFIFQPAEETGRGANQMIDQGVLNGVDEAFGIHVSSAIPTGVVAAMPGPSFAAADFFTVNFIGKGGHGADPANSIDAVVMGAHFITSAQTIISRMVDPIQSGVLTCGSLNSGVRENIIAQEAVVKGTVRTFYPEARDQIETALQEMAQHVAAMYGGQAKVEYHRLTQVVNNHSESVARVTQIAKEALGEDGFMPATPTMGGEDFGYYTNRVPGVFIQVGTMNEAKDTAWPHHHSRFDLDEDGFANGTEMYVRYALSYLNQ